MRGTLFVPERLLYLVDTEHRNVQFRMADEIAIIRIDNPPVNAGSHAVRSGVVECITNATVSKAQGAVILGAGRCFIAGSDLREFGKPLLSPELPDVIEAIEAAPFPVVAVIHGVALGGGLELALGCDYRVATPDAMLGLPEVSLGFVPGAGGTQRLPRLIGVAKAIELICAASRISARDAIDLGLIDGLLEGDLLDAALDFLRSVPRIKRHSIAMTPPMDDPKDIEKAEHKAKRLGKGQITTTEAIRLIRATLDTPAETALADEREVFQRLRISDEAFALRYLFFSERRAAVVDGLDMKAAKSAGKVGVIGGGTMGQGIARSLLSAGVSVTVVERSDDAMTSAIGKINEAWASKLARGRLSEGEAARRRDALHGSIDLNDLRDCDLVIEAVFEDMGVKKVVLSDLEAAIPETAIIATNTSYLDIDVMVAELAHPERVLGLHFFSPADVMKLLEVVRADKTSDASLATGLKLARKLGKQTVVASVAEGFIGNRIYAAYRRCAELLVLDGATPAQVDQAVTDFGFAMGPFAVADMSGLDIAWAMRRRHSAARDPKARYVKIPDMLCEAGRLGRKTGSGWYDYSGGSLATDPLVSEIIDRARQEAGITPQDFDTDTIQRQLMAAITNEAACLLAEGVAQRPSDVDVVLVNGYGFPRWRGGPLYWASKQDRSDLKNDLNILANAVGHDFKAGPVIDVLMDLKSQSES